MANSTIERKDDGTIQLNITLLKSEVAKVHEEMVLKAVENAEITGFRKGKAPRDLVEKNLDSAKIHEEVLRKLLPEAYVNAVQEHKLQPIMNPKIHVDKLDDDKDWVITALTCEMPEVKLNKYKDAVKNVTAKSKIIVPGKETKEASLDQIVSALLEETQVQIPNLLLEQEVDRLLAQTLDEIKRLGLTLDQYLQSTGKKPEEMKSEYALKAANDIKLEFVLQNIAETEKIVVEPTELEEAINKAKDPIEKENLEKNRYVLANILRQQKTLDFLKNI